MEKFDNNTISLALCEARHAMPECVKGSIFNNTLDPLDVKGLEAEASAKLASLNVKAVNIYVTGLTVALIAVLNAAKNLEIKVTLYHYNRDTNSYYIQEVL